jgi:DinB family protein
MSTVTGKTVIGTPLDARVLSRILEEGYGPDAWHGPDLKSALDDVTAALAHWRPGAGRHSIAEIALHHAYHTHAVRSKLAATAPEPFVLSGEDWFAVTEQGSPGWAEIRSLVDREYATLMSTVADIAAGRSKSPLNDAERVDLVLGITCHAVYHAGQVQLIKRLRGD